MCDAIYAWHPSLTIGVAVAIVAAIKRAPLVYDVQDIWPEGAVWAGMIKSPMLIWLLHGLERFVYRRAAHILVVTEGEKANLVGKGVDPARISVVAHWIDDELFDREDLVAEPIRERYGLQDKFIVMFAGTVSSCWLSTRRSSASWRSAATSYAPRSGTRSSCAGK